ncbi:MAG: isoprenylcysteine carboxylmethyltransferase family protein [Alphaproteobacteria bacterium]|nr:isoprenylcysteine carboxylmethyltransferase family protein [Alphaproteobacteria bacterium]
MSREILLKARIRHTRLLALALVPGFLVTRGAWEGWTHFVLAWLGVGLIALCVLGRAYASAFVGGKKNYEVVADGPFSVVRNPLYVFSFIGVIGIGLTTGSVGWAVILGSLFAVYYPAVVEREEAHLTEIFGEAYTAYRAATPRWIPDFSRWRAPDTVSLNPVFLYRTMRDGAWFFVAPPVLAAIRILQDQGTLPVWILWP